MTELENIKEGQDFIKIPNNLPNPEISKTESCYVFF